MNRIQDFARLFNLEMGEEFTIRDKCLNPSKETYRFIENGCQVKKQFSNEWEDCYENDLPIFCMLNGDANIVPIRKDRVRVYVTKNELQVVKNLAKKSGTNVSNYVRNLIKKDIKERGIDINIF